jgi:uncharacterized membrane protein YraQ (UPF0718 family)
VITSALGLLAELLVLFVLVAVAIELLQRRVGPRRLQAWMGGRPVIAALKGIAIGFVTPFCTYSAIPMLVGLRRAGVAPAGYVAFIVAAPVLDPILFGALTLIVGLPVAVTYLAVAFTAAMGLALVADRVGIEAHLRPLPAVAPRTDSAGCAAGPEPWGGLLAELGRAGRQAARLLRSVGVLLIIGVGLGVVIELALPVEVTGVLDGGRSVWAVPVAAALGTPLYIHTELFVPIAGSLHRSGVGIGPIVALTIAGAGANVPELLILGRLARLRLVGTLFAYIFLIAVVGGGLAQAVSR